MIYASLFHFDHILQWSIFHLVCFHRSCCSNSHCAQVPHNNCNNFPWQYDGWRYASEKVCWKFATTDTPKPIPIFSYSCRIESLSAYEGNWIRYPNGVVITHNLNPNFMDLPCMYCMYSKFPKVRNHGFGNAYMLGRLAIQNALFVNSIK